MVNNQTVSGDVAINVQVNSPSLTSGSAALKLDTTSLGTSEVTKDINGQATIFFSLTSDDYANGSHTIVVSSSTYQESYTLIFDNDVVNLQVDPVFDLTTGVSDVPSSSQVSADVANPSAYPNWTVVFTDLDGNIVRSYSGSGSHVAVTWNGKNASGTEVADQPYEVTITPKSGSATNSVSSFQLADYRPHKSRKPRLYLIQSSGSRPGKRVVNKNRLESDNLFLIDTTAIARSSKKVANEYWKYIKSQFDLPRMSGCFSTPLNFILVDGSRRMYESNSPVARRLDASFKKRKKLIYINCHGAVDEENRPRFFIGENYWYSALGAGEPGFGVEGYRGVDSLVGSLGYGDGQDPPRLVWIDTCCSYGGSSDNNQWARTFGMTNTSGGAFLGWRGDAIGYGASVVGRPGTPRCWDAWRVNMWNFLCAGGNNVGTAYRRCNSPGVTPTDGFFYLPHNQSRTDGDATSYLP